MMLAAAYVFAGALFSITSAVPDAPLRVAYDQTITIPAEGVTAAYAVDSSVAEAAVIENAVKVHGKGAGTTAIVVITPSAVTTVRVTVSEPPLVLPAEFRRTISGSATHGGSAEIRYVSEPGEISTTVDMRRQEADRTQRLRIVTANPIGAHGDARTAIPFASYQLSTPKRDITILDQTVTNSPLTLNGEFVRGLHVREGPWSFHGGVTSIALFQNAFFSTAPEYVGGVTREFRLSSDHTLAANAYYFRNASQEREIATNGVVGSLFHTYRSPVRNLIVRSELAVSRGGVGAAAEASREEPGLHFAANIRYEPPKFPALAIANLHGLFGDADLVRAWSERTSFAASAVISEYHLTDFHQRNLGASTTISHKITPHLTGVGGVLYSSFQSDAQAFDLRTAALPVGLDYAWKHAYAGFRDQPTTDFEGRVANGYSVNGGASFAHFSVSGYFRHDVELPAVSTFFTAVPGLQEAFERSGIFIARPSQLIALLRDAGLLARLGFTTPLGLRLAPSRNDIGGNVDWFVPHQRLSFSFLRSNTHLVQESYRINTSSLSYTRSLLSGTELAGFITWGGTVGGGNTPIVGVLLRQPITSLSRLLPGTHGEISGHVFRDEEATAAYSPAAKPLAGVEVRLDDTRVARTDSSGYYEFRGVAAGRHRLEARVPTNEKFYFTTDSPAYSDINTVVNFGVSFVRGAIFGEVVNDAGEGVGGIAVALDGGSIHRNAVADAGGEFRFHAVPDGQYVISVATETFPAGYDLSSVQPVKAEVKAAEPASVKIVAKALRSISGTVQLYDVGAQKEVPVAGVEVAIPELVATTKTNAAGKYLFRRVPAGSYTVAVTAGGEQRSLKVEVPSQPGIVTADNITLTHRPDPQATEKAAPLPTSDTIAHAIALVNSGRFRGAVEIFEAKAESLSREQRFYYAVALYEMRRYAAAKRELAQAQPPDTEQARRYVAKIVSHP